jgi:hypothetical protein
MSDRPLIEPCRTPERAIAFLTQVCASRKTLWRNVAWLKFRDLSPDVRFVRDDGSPYPLACIVHPRGYVLHFVSIDGRLAHALSVATITPYQEAAA